MKSTKLISVTAMAAFALLATPDRSLANGKEDHKHHHYKLVDLGTFGGPGSSPTEFLQVLNNAGTLVGGADTSTLNPYPNCFNPFNLPTCYVQRAFAWQDGELTDLGTLAGGSASFAYFVSDSGLITGGSENGDTDPFSGNPENHAVLWSHGTMTDLGTLGGASSLGVGVNGAGQVTGFGQNAIPDPFSFLGGTQTRAFLWHNGEMQDLGTLGGPDAFAQYVNNKGQVAGVSYTSYTTDPNTGAPPLDPFLWEKGKGMKDLGNFGGSNGFLGPFIYGLSDEGEVIGNMVVAGNQVVHAFLWDGEKLSDLPDLGGSYSQANGLNDAGEVVGQSNLTGDQAQHAVLWKKGTITDLGTLHGDPCSEAGAINSKGQVVGASQSAAGGCNFFTSAFLWEHGGPSVDLNILVPAGSPLQLTGAFWINNRGEITGRGVLAGCDDVDNCGHAFLLIPCDENHLGIEGCDYRLLEVSAAMEAGTSHLSAPSKSTVHDNSQIGLRGLLRPRFAERFSSFGVQPQK